MSMALPGCTLRRLMRRAASSSPARWAHAAGAGVASTGGSAGGTAPTLWARRCTRLMPNSTYNRLPTTGDNHASPIHDTADPGLRLCASTCSVTPAARAKCAIDSAIATYGTSSGGTRMDLALQPVSTQFVGGQFDRALERAHLVKPHALVQRVVGSHIGRYPAAGAVQHRQAQQVILQESQY